MGKAQPLTLAEAEAAAERMARGQSLSEQDGPQRDRDGVCSECRSIEARTAAHGTEARYKRCKCAGCREASRVARARRRAANSQPKTEPRP